MAEIFGYSSQAEALEVVGQYGVDLDADISRIYGGASCVKLAILDEMAALEEGGPFERHVTDGGADYYASRLDYLSGDGKVKASRMFARILGGQRTETKLWTAAAPPRTFDVYQGRGFLMASLPGDGQTDGPAATMRTENFRLDAAVRPSLTLPPGSFYSFEGNPYQPDEAAPLVVSSFTGTAQRVDWEAMDITVQLGQSAVETPDGPVPVPDVMAPKPVPRS